MGSDSDWRVMSDASQALTDFGIAHEVEVVSAHRTPDKLLRTGARLVRGLRAIIAGPGAAHCPACWHPSPRCRSSVCLCSWRLSTAWTRCSASCRCPPAFPWRRSRSTGRRTRAFAARILGASDADLADRVEQYARDLEAQVEEKNRRLKESL
jgi:5-(carboxyamino)imidazole ribonucleotide mutase